MNRQTHSSQMTRREMLLATTTVPLVARVSAAADKTEDKKKSPLHDEVGITTSSLSGHVSSKGGAGKIGVMDLPKLLSDELDMRVIDLNTSTIAGLSNRQLDQFRKAAESAGSTLTNLKMNQRGLDLADSDDAKRNHTLDTYRKSIDVAARLGTKWARPLPLARTPDWKKFVAAYQQLAEYGAKRNVQLLVENYGWLDKQPDLTVKVLDAIGSGVAASPDTGNWANNEVRYAGLKLLFPRAVTCDFKARKLGPNGEHSLYDLKRCFSIGNEVGFRGPWCLEHANIDRKVLFRELGLLRDLLRSWIKAGHSSPK